MISKYQFDAGLHLPHSRVPGFQEFFVRQADIGDCKYVLVVFIKNDGDYDLDKTQGTVVDPLATVHTAQSVGGVPPLPAALEKAAGGFASGRLKFSILER